MIVWLFDFQLHVQSVPITTKVVSSNPALWFFPFFSTNKTELHALWYNWKIDKSGDKHPNTSI